MPALTGDRQDLALTVGVLGGMGPEATVDFMRRVIAMTPADRDQDHVRMLIDNNPHVPDRQQAMREDALPVRAALAAMARHLQDAGADFLVMPCNTAHAFIDDAVTVVSIPFIDIVDVTIQSIVETFPDARRVGLLATDACLASGVYQRAVELAGLDLLLPDVDLQTTCMALIARIKGGDTGDDVGEGMARLAAALVERGADAVIAGCTEIPLVLTDATVAVPLISSTEVLATRTVEFATGARPLPAAQHRRG